MAVSFGANLALGYARPDGSAAFYLPISRVWELEVGAILAWAPQHLKATAAVASLTHRTTFWLREAVSFCGVSLLVLVGLPWIGVDEEMMFPGWIAWLPTLGTALVIAAGDGCCGQACGRCKVSTRSSPTDVGGGEGATSRWRSEILFKDLQPMSDL